MTLGEWIAEVKNELTSSEAGMCTKGKLMEISQEGSTCQLLFTSRPTPRVRQLTELGVTVPDSIKQAAKDGEQYYRFGVVLKKWLLFSIVWIHRYLRLNAQCC